MIEKFQVDMHQRDQETVVSSVDPETPAKVLRRKPFYAAELVMKGLDLRALLANFPERLKQLVPVSSSSQTSNYRTRSDLPPVDPQSPWYDADDFHEIDWSSQETPVLHILPVVSCPRFMYFKRNPMDVQTESSKFGNEETHRCLLGKEPCRSRLASCRSLLIMMSSRLAAPQVQISLASDRISELRNAFSKTSPHAQTVCLICPHCYTY